MSLEQRRNCWFTLAGVGSASALLAFLPESPRQKQQYPDIQQSLNFMKAVLLFIIFLLFIPSVNAQGIGVSPNKIEINTIKGEEVEKQIIIFNPSNEKADFVIEASNWFSFSQKELSIDPYEKRKVLVKIKPEKIGQFEETINIMLKPNNSKGLAINLGATVKAKIKSETRTNFLVGASLSASIVCLGLVLARIIKFKLVKRPKQLYEI